MPDEAKVAAAMVPAATRRTTMAIYHKFNISQFPKAAKELMETRVKQAAALKATDDALDTLLQTYAGKIRVPVMVDSGKLTAKGNVKYVEAADGAKVTLPNAGERIAVSWRYLNDGEVSLYSDEPKSKTAKKSKGEILIS